MKDRRECPNCAAALALLNQHLKGRVYTDLDDAFRNMLQAFITIRDNEKQLADELAKRFYHRKDRSKDFNEALEMAARLVPGILVAHGDQYGTWAAPIEKDQAKTISEAILRLKREENRSKDQSRPYSDAAGD
jgi:glutaredoxin-related protein